MINKSFFIVAILFTMLSISAVTVTAQNSKTSKLPIKHEPSPSHPYGKLNPKAPAETAQFAFMIGEFNCKDKIRGPKGKWAETNVIWNSSFFLNGAGIQDKFWSKQITASGTRIFNKKKGKWIVNYFQTFPTYFAGVWEGKKEGDKMIMRAPRGENESRLTFHNITKDGFDWIGETVSKDGKATPFWIISCKRRR